MLSIEADLRLIGTLMPLIGADLRLIGTLMLSIGAAVGSFRGLSQLIKAPRRSIDPHLY